MNRVIVTAFGVLLAGGAASVLAGSGDRQQLAQCKALVDAHFGDDTRTRLRSIRSRADGTYMRLSVRPADGDKRRIVCTRNDDGLSLSTGDGVALVAQAEAADTVSVAH